jgi:hypothetical protein
LPEAAPGIGDERIDRAPAQCIVKPVDPLDGGQIGLDRFDPGAAAADRLRRRVNLRLVGRDDQVEAPLGAAFRQLVADAARRAGDDGKRPGSLCHASSPSMHRID